MRRTLGAGWGRTVLPYFLPPKSGPAETTAAVRPGQLAELAYKAPLYGVGITIAIVAVPFVILFLVIVFTILMAANLSNAVPVLRGPSWSPILG